MHAFSFFQREEAGTCSWPSVLERHVKNMDGWFPEAASILGSTREPPRSGPPSVAGSSGSARGNLPPASGSFRSNVNGAGNYDLGSASAPTAGVHAVMMGSSTFPVIDEVPRGGQLGRQGVGAGDSLIAVDARSVEGLTLKVIKAMIEGSPGSVVELTLQRPTGEKYDLRVIRTVSLGEDIQLATYGELMQFVEAPLGTDFYRLSQRPDEGEHEMKATHDKLLSKINEYKYKALSTDTAERLAQAERQIEEVTYQRDDLARKLDENYREGEKIIKDLRDTLSALDVKNQRLAAEVNDMRQKEVTALTLGLTANDTPPSDPASRKALEDRVQRELGDVLGVPTERVEIIGLHKGALKADINILPDPSRQGPTSKQLADSLFLQTKDPSNPLRRAVVLKDLDFVDLKDPHDWVLRLRATVDLLQVRWRRRTSRTSRRRRRRWWIQHGNTGSSSTRS
jgi:hypothetical protein